MKVGEAQQTTKADSGPTSAAKKEKGAQGTSEAGADHKRESPAERFARMAEPERQLQASGYCRVAGIDEAGRGPLAGPVYAAAVVLDPDRPIIGLNDSKRLSPKKREQLAALIRTEALAWGIGFSTAAEIDRDGILPATLSAMQRALSGLPLEPDYLLFDYVTGYKSDRPAAFIKKGDAFANCIAAASILAKVSRDRYMQVLEEKLPGYGFAQHKGYGTASHYEALDRLGPSVEHRHSFLKNWQKGGRHQHKKG